MAVLLRTVRNAEKMKPSAQSHRQIQSNEISWSRINNSIYFLYTLPLFLSRQQLRVDLQIHRKRISDKES